MDSIMLSSVVSGKTGRQNPMTDYHSDGSIISNPRKLRNESLKDLNPEDRDFIIKLRHDYKDMLDLIRDDLTNG